MQVYIILNLRNPSINSKNVREYFFLIFFFIVVLANFLNPLHKEQNKSKAYNFFSADTRLTDVKCEFLTMIL